MRWFFAGLAALSVWVALGRATPEVAVFWLALAAGCGVLWGVLSARGARQALAEEQIAGALEMERTALEAFSTRLGLALERGSAGPGRWAAFSLSGRLDGPDGAPGTGRRVTITCGASGPEVPSRCAVRAVLARPLPTGVRIEKRDQDSPSGLRTGNLLLDRELLIVGSEPERLRRILTDARVTPALMAVVHQWPGSTVIAEAVVLRRPLRRFSERPWGISGELDLAALEAAVVEACALADALDRATAPPGAP